MQYMKKKKIPSILEACKLIEIEKKMKSSS